MPQKKAQLAEQAQHITINQHRLYYRTAGRGTPLVLIHGYGNSGQVWQPVLPYLAQQHQVFIVDLPGYGQSKLDGEWYLREMAPLLAQWLDTLQLPAAALLGHSMGGAIAIHLAAYAPEKFNRLILANAAGIPLRAELPALATRSLHSFFQINNGKLPYSLVRDMLPPDMHLLWQTAQEMKRSDFRAELEQITLPTLIIWGERDVLLPLTLGRMLHEALPHATLMTMPQCGHRPMLAQPAQFSQAVLAFTNS
ncbi:MAG: alpha/beta hydrolase [Ktedonobacteraceae bacterium]|nr:alpha/beta hydrolase [Ktedonobacteraceae bacterium]